MKNKILVGTLATALLFGGAFAVGASNNDDVSKVDVKANEYEIHSKYR